MENNISILIYEKDKILKSIITKQLSYVKEYKLYSIEKNENVLSVLTNTHFDAFILNLNDLERDIPTFFEIIHNNKKHKNIIIYYDNHLTKVTDIDKSIIYLKKPFKISSLLKYLKDYNNNNKENNSEILEADIRETKTSSDIKKLRIDGHVPGVLYGDVEKNLNLTVKRNALEKLLKIGKTKFTFKVLFNRQIN